MPRKSKKHELKEWLKEKRYFVFDVEYELHRKNELVIADSFDLALEAIKNSHMFGGYKESKLISTFENAVTY